MFKWDKDFKLFNFKLSFRRLNIIFYSTISFLNLIVLVLFILSFFFYYQDVYIYNYSDQISEKYCRCGYFGSFTYLAFYKHKYVLNFNTASIFLSALSLSLIISRKDILISTLANKKFKHFDEMMKGKFKNLKSIKIEKNDATTKYKEVFKASIIQIGLIAAFSDDKLFAWCTINATFEILFFGLAGLFSGILCLYSFFKVIEKCVLPDFPEINGDDSASHDETVQKYNESKF